jgi:radical SAM protein with 4Fe4S-binding SPASM domain
MPLISQLKSRLSSLVVKPPSNGQKLEPGLYHYRRMLPGEQARMHLRIDPDGTGVLLVNASRVYHLNATAAGMAYLALEERPDSVAVEYLNRQFRAGKAQLQADYLAFKSQLDELCRPDGACPVCDLELETTLPFSARPTAPYRMDLAVTYRCNNNCSHCYNARPRHGMELNTEAWMQILDRLWELRIPHVVFTGGEPTLRNDLPELIAHAERNGQITGINTNGRRLCDPGYVETLVQAGLDHVQVTLESHDPEVHDALVCAPGAFSQTVAGIGRALSTSLFVMTNTTLLQQNSLSLSQTLDMLASLGVPTVGLNALIYSGRGLNVGTGLPEDQLPPLLEIARQRTDQAGQRLIWYTPTEYCHFDPVQMDLGVKGCTAAYYNMCVEPDGAVIPCQSYYQPLGNLLSDPWEGIWNHELAVNLRDRKGVPERCQACAFLTECGGGCPLHRQAHSRPA